jgi:hypothetical protein
MDLEEFESPQDPGADDHSSSLGWTAKVRQVSGRGSDDSRGLPPVSSMTVSRPDGPDLILGPVNNDGAKLVQVKVLGVPEIRNFGLCPICGSEDDLTREHVPQRDLGGTVMTYTCKPCNNGLGSRVEDELKHWFDGAIFDVKFSGGGVPGVRRAPRMLLRASADGELAMIEDKGRRDPNISSMLSSGTAQIHYRIPNPRVWRVAVLKHAYLAACLALGEIPSTHHAAVLRGVLVTTRDARRGELPPENNLAKTMRIAQSNQPAQGPTVILGALVGEDDEIVDYGLSFAGTLFASWPLDADLFWKAAHRLSTTVGQTA